MPIRTREEVPQGTRFGHLTIISEYNKDRRRIMISICDCGQISHRRLSHLKERRNNSCGCLSEYYRRLCTHKTHGMTRTKTYYVWTKMKDRCTNKRANNYKDYGGRGITVCDRWMTSFTHFMEDMGIKPEGSSLDRIDNNGNYSKENCRWATSLVQGNNKRSNVHIRFEGEVYTRSELARHLGLSYAIVRRRYDTI